MQYGSMNIHNVTNTALTQSVLPNGVKVQDILITTNDGNVFTVTCFLEEKFEEQQSE